MANGVSGLSSGIDSQAIIDALINSAGVATKLLSNRKDLYSQRLEAVRNYNTRLLSAQLDLTDLRRTSTFNARTASSSNTSAISATATSNAVIGTTQVDVVAIAKAQQRSSTGYASSTVDIGTGDIVLQLGNGAQKTLTVTAGNGSLTNIAQAINSANAGVTAAVVNDGSGGASAYRLLVQSSTTGASNQVKLTSTGTLADLFTSRSTAQVDAVTNLGAGGLNISVGSATAHAFNFIAGASSLTDIRDAINADLTLGATAALDGANQRLILTPTVAGTSIGVSGTGVMSSLFQAGGNVLTEAADAVLQIGSGGGAITVTKASNTVSDLIDGVTLTLKAPGTGIAIDVGSDPAKTKTALHKFVDSYNSAANYLNGLTGYDTQTGVPGLLLAETSLRRGLNDVSRTFASADFSLPTGMNAVTALGVSIDRKTGLYTIDDAVFDAKLAADPAGVAKLFTNTATTSNNLVQFGSLSDGTKVDKPFTVDILVAAEQALAGNTANLAASTVIGAGNKFLSVEVNDKLYNVTLAEGTYTREALAAHVAATINAVADNGSQVVASLNGDGLELRTARYGSTQEIQVTGGSANADLFLATTIDNGVDVAGTITVDGITTAGTGTGQVLSGDVATPAKGLRLTVTAAAPLAGIVITARKGLGQLVTEQMHLLTDSTTGSVVTKDKSLTDSVTDMEKQISKADARLAERRRRYEAQFLQMEKLISQFKSQGNFISSQIKGFENAAAGNARA